MDDSQVMIVGVDGGGSKTRAWLAKVDRMDGDSTQSFEVLGQGEAGPSNPRSVGFERAIMELEKAIGSAISQVKEVPAEVASACLCLAGAGRDEEKEKFHEWAATQRLARHIFVVDDVEPLRHAAAYEHRRLSAARTNAADPNWDKSVTLVVGTGSIALGSNGKQETARAGGWGFLLGDEGSGYAIGLEGLKIVCQQADEGGKRSPFAQALLDRLNLQSPQELIGLVYQFPIPRSTIANLAEVIVQRCPQDPLAVRIIDQAIQSWADLVSKVAQRLHLNHLAYSLALSGGILAHHPVLVKRLMSELAKRHQSPRNSHLVQEPLHGALTLAIRSIAPHPANKG